MTKYEYDFEVLEITEDQKHVMQMGLGDIDHLSLMVKEVVNRKAAEGWEPLYPFSVPQVWFRKAKPTRRKTTKTS